LEELREYLDANSFSRFAADQVFNWIYKRLIFDPNKWTNVSKKIKEHFDQKLCLELPKIIWNGLSKDGTRKFLTKFLDDQTVENVAIPFKDRLTICLSSQVGCAIGCVFCHTGTMGLKRHLGSSEIVGQFLAITRWLIDNVDEKAKFTNVVYMGQGEPLHNFNNVKQATEILLEDKGIGLGQRRITLSTSGLVPQIEKLVDFPSVNLAISLHAAHDNIRTELMPINKVYDLKRLFAALKKIPLKAHRRITYEYILIDGLNDRPEDIDGLVSLINSRQSKINIIPFNEYPESSFKRPSDKKIRWFQKELLDRGYITTVRVTMGQDILAACGQLKSEMENPNLWKKA
jgi:23S rRNA (adenine2503-C2)-methyltransferase